MVITKNIFLAFSHYSQTSDDDLKIWITCAYAMNFAQWGFFTIFKQLFLFWVYPWDNYANGDVYYNWSLAFYRPPWPLSNNLLIFYISKSCYIQTMTMFKSICVLLYISSKFHSQTNTSISRPTTYLKLYIFDWSLRMSRINTSIVYPKASFNIRHFTELVLCIVIFIPSENLIQNLRY